MSRVLRPEGDSDEAVEVLINGMRMMKEKNDDDDDDVEEEEEEEEKEKEKYVVVP